jgi:hypothetical protein
MNTIYIYTTEYNRLLGQYKLGESKKQTAKKRIGQQKTGSSEEFITIFEGKTILSDHKVRQLLRLLGYHKVTREWVGGFKSDDEAIAAVSKIIAESVSYTRV